MAIHPSRKVPRRFLTACLETLQRTATPQVISYMETLAIERPYFPKTRVRSVVGAHVFHGTKFLFLYLSFSDRFYSDVRLDESQGVPLSLLRFYRPHPKQSCNCGKNPHSRVEERVGCAR